MKSSNDADAARVFPTQGERRANVHCSAPRFTDASTQALCRAFTEHDAADPLHAFDQHPSSNDGEQRGCRLP